MTDDLTHTVTITIDCKGSTVEEIDAKLDEIANGETIKFSNDVIVTSVDNKTKCTINLSAQQMVTNLRSAGVSQTRLAKHLQCTQASVSRWQAGRNVPSGEVMLRLVAYWREKCGG